MNLLFLFVKHTTLGFLGQTCLILFRIPIAFTLNILRILATVQGILIGTYFQESGNKVKDRMFQLAKVQSSQAKILFLLNNMLCYENDKVTDLECFLYLPSHFHQVYQPNDAQVFGQFLNLIHISLYLLIFRLQDQSFHVKLIAFTLKLQLNTYFQYALFHLVFKEPNQDRYHLTLVNELSKIVFYFHLTFKLLILVYYLSGVIFLKVQNLRQLGLDDLHLQHAAVFYQLSVYFGISVQFSIQIMKCKA